MTDSHSQGDLTPRPTDGTESDGGKLKDGKLKKLFGLGKKKTEEPAKPSPSNSATPSLSKEPSTLSAGRSTSQHETFAPPLSPTRALSTSPRLASPARSQIFERDVQDDAIVQPRSPAIPNHIQTENHIPPVLNDASEAITNNKLDPDSVEIVTHNSHQPAAVTVTGTTSAVSGTPYDQTASEWAKELSSFADRNTAVAPDNASNYGSLDSADVRRLSFISFADVVQAEHGVPPAMTGSRDSIHVAGLTSLSQAGLNRSPSPIMSPVSSQGGPGTSPPTSNPGSMKGVEMSPPRRPLGSPGSGIQSLTAGTQSGELTIETMSQALRRTTSSDLSHVRSIPTSPIDGPGSR